MAKHKLCTTAWKFMNLSGAWAPFLLDPRNFVQENPLPTEFLLSDNSSLDKVGMSSTQICNCFTVFRNILTAPSASPHFDSRVHSRRHGKKSYFWLGL